MDRADPDETEREVSFTPERPAPGEGLNLGAATIPRQAATLILLRDGAERMEVLLVKRNPKARFMGGVWVFPGGAVDAGDGEAGGDDPGNGSPDGIPDGAPDSGPDGVSDGSARDPHRAAAVRELREEAGIAVEDPATLVAISRWITPAAVKVRYDTHFFLAPLPARQEARVDGEECVDCGWFSPEGALEAHAKGEIALVFPTIAHLRRLTPFATATEAIAHARTLTIEPVLPKVVVEGDAARVLLPGDPGY
jgi:8-oxo-dGTP pyrophosphatase MutT (NUDIX family)